MDHVLFRNVGIRETVIFNFALRVFTFKIDEELLQQAQHPNAKCHVSYCVGLRHQHLFPVRLRRWFGPLIIDRSVYTDDELRSTAIPVVPCSCAQSDLLDAIDNG